MKTASKLLLFLGVLACLAISTGTAEAGRLFFSTSSTDPSVDFTAGVASNTNLAINLLSGQSVTVYMWYERFGNTNGNISNGQGDVIDGLSLDILSSSPLVTRTGLTLDNPLDEDVTGENRWGSVGLGGAPTTSVLVDDSNTVATGGSFFGKTFDPLRSATASAILDPTTSSGPNAGVARYGSLTLLAGATAGTTQIRYAVGPLGISYVNANNVGELSKFGFGDNAVSGATAGATSTLADLTITVIVPEPSSLALLGLGGLGLLLIHRRRAT